MFKDRSPTQLRRIARGILDGKITWSKMLGNFEIYEVFLPLTLMDEEVREKIRFEYGSVYQHNERGAPLGVDEQLVFFSCEFLTEGDTLRLKLLIEELANGRNPVLGSIQLLHLPVEPVNVHLQIHLLHSSLISFQPLE